MKKLYVLLVSILVLGMICGTLPISAASAPCYPEDLFSSAAVCGQYFHNAEEPGTTYEQVDGEYVMTMPLHAAFNYLYSKEAVSFDTFTVTFDFYLIISPDSHFHEMSFLFGMSGEAKPFHQVSLVSQGGSLYLRHYTLTEAWYEYEEDGIFYDVYEEEYWMTFKAEITPEDVTIYVDDYEIATLSDSDGCVGTNGYIGLRAGSAGGWKVKNLNVVEGVQTEVDATPTEEPTEVPTQAPTAEPTAETTETASLTPSTEVTIVPTQNPAQPKGGNFPWWIAGVIAVMLVVAGVAIWLIIKKKNK